MSKNRVIFIIGLLLVFITVFNGPPPWFKWTIVFFSGISLILLSLSVSVGRRSPAVKENAPGQEKTTVSEVIEPKPEENLEDKKD